MSSTYLELTNKVLTQYNQTVLNSGTFSTARNIQLRAKDAVNFALSKMESKHFEWPFNFNQDQSQTCTAGTFVYSFPANFKKVDWESFYIYSDGTISTNTKYLKRINKDEWIRSGKESDLDNVTLGRAKPLNVAPYGNKQFIVTPNPNAAFVIKYDYWNKLTLLSAHDDTTTVPPEFDHVIVAGAMVYMAWGLSDIEASDRLKEDFREVLGDMRDILINQEEDVTSGMNNYGQLEHMRYYDVSFD